MKTVEVTDAMEPLARYAREAAEEPLILVDHGIPIAAVIPFSPEDMDSAALAAQPRFLELIAEARAQYRAGESLSAEEVRRELGVS